MSSDPILHGMSYSGYVKVIRLVLDEKGISYQFVPFDMPIPPDFIRLNPFKKVPVLQHGDFVLYEAVAIARYLDEGFDGIALQPQELQPRSRMAQIISIMDQVGAPMMLRTVYYQRFIQKILQQPHDESSVQVGLEQCKLCLMVFEDILADHSYLVGNDITLADLFVAPNIFYFDDSVEGEIMLNQFPKLRQWMGRMKERPSVQKVGLPELPAPKAA